eukprot:augustus_masked-scaffold_7-processed-gene-17.36-mRNA-1 protein AED:1.00 eAED:1.00 QI:0/-1/0/0/-1/1/1/0/299
MSSEESERRSIRDSIRSSLRLTAFKPASGDESRKLKFNSKDEENEDIVAHFEEYTNQPAHKDLEAHGLASAPPPPNYYPKNEEGEALNPQDSNGTEFMPMKQIEGFKAQLEKEKLEKAERERKTKRKITWVEQGACLFVLVTIVMLVLYFGTQSSASSTSALTEANETAFPTTAPISAAPSASSTFTPTSKPISDETVFPTSQPSSSPVDSSTPFDEMTEEEVTARVESICSEYSGSKELAGMCLGKNLHAQCNNAGAVVYNFKDCADDVTCDCGDFVLVADKNPCSPRQGNSCDLSEE